jgi:uncharacterized membrane protein YhaH (DUF805 family)
MRNLTLDKPGTYKKLSGSYTPASSRVSTEGRTGRKRYIMHKLIFITARLLALAAALALMIYSVSWASEGLWDTATMVFFAGMIFFIPFILFSRKIKTIKKVKKYTKRNNPIIGWKYSG